jgi:homocysteine S-methyltransferase
MEHLFPTPRKHSPHHPPVLLLDGGLGTTLKDQHQSTVDGPSRPLWSSHLLISDPATLAAVQTAFADAGADVLLTATYQASLEGFARTENPENGKVGRVGKAGGIEREDAARYMRSAVGIARSAFGNRRGGDGQSKGIVALSLGAYGATMIPSQEYSGKYDQDHMTVPQLRDWHLERLGMFIEVEDTWNDIDIVAFETVPLLREIVAVRQTMFLAHEKEPRNAEKPFWISCVFPETDMRLPDGSSVGQVVEAMLGKGGNAALPAAVGINCTKIGKVGELLGIFESAVRKMIEAKELERAPALVLYPDGTKGEVYNTATHEWEVQDGGGNLVGGFFQCLTYRSTFLVYLLSQRFLLF